MEILNFLGIPAFDAFLSLYFYAGVIILPFAVGIRLLKESSQ